VAIQKDLYRMHTMVTITADVMSVGGIQCLVTYSRGINFCTAEFVAKRTAKILAKSRIKVLMIYAQGGFIVNLVLLNKEFNAIKEHVPLLQVNTVAFREHVGVIKRSIRTTKERTRYTTS
jgi:hypothetical protein